METYNLPKIEDVRKEVEKQRVKKAQSDEQFYINLKNKIMRYAAYYIKENASKGHTTIGYWQDKTDGEFTYQEHCCDKFATGYDVEHIWKECVDEIKKHGYEATLDTTSCRSQLFYTPVYFIDIRW